MNATMTMDLTVMNEAELENVEGGIWQGIAVGVVAYKALLDKIEANPGDYTWTMDWYYS